MAIPMKPLCRADCRGPVRRVRKRPEPAAPCGCARDAVDPRWEALRGASEEKV